MDAVLAMSDDLLLANLLAKKPEAWRAFRHRFDRLIFRCIRNVLSRFSASASSEDARDVYAHFLLGLLRRDMRQLRAFDRKKGAKFASWIAMLATNAAWDHIRIVSRRFECNGHDDLAESESDPYAELLRKERWAQLDAQLCRFTSKDREFLQLYYVDGLAPEDVASKMQISLKTVYSKKHKIQSRLQQVLSVAA